MLTPTDVLNYVKTKLGIPYTPSEYTDDQILNYIRNVPLRTFSRLVPHCNKIIMDLSDPNVQTSIPNEFRIIDPDGCQIVSVRNFYTDQTPLITSGHPVIGLLGGDMHEAENYALQVETSMTVFKYSMFNEHIEFIPPNILRVMPRPEYKSRLLEYERFHTPDFRTILPEFEDIFLNLAYCDVAIWIARTRSAFRTLNTPFGDIELNADELKSDAQAEKDKILEELSLMNPSIIIDSG